MKCVQPIDEVTNAALERVVLIRFKDFSHCHCVRFLTIMSTITPKNLVPVLAFMLMATAVCTQCSTERRYHNSCGCCSCSLGCVSSSGCGSSSAGATITIGIDYGRVANNLPSACQVVSLLQGRGVKNVKIYDADSDVLQAFANTGIEVSVTIPNDQVATFAADQSAATTWVVNNIQPYGCTKIGSIAVGNEYLSDSSLDMTKLVPAMQNVQTALESLGLAATIQVSTPHSFGVMGASYPPSAGSFQTQYTAVMKSLLSFLSQKGSVFMVNIYPFFAYRDNPQQISLDYALFNSNASVVYDSGRQYTNLFDAQLDSVVFAMTQLGFGNMSVVVTESGWPSGGGGVGVSVQNAQTYNNNLVKHVLGNVGTPFRPGANIQTYIFALFNENLKGGDATETHFGLFYPDQTPVYDINLSPSPSIKMKGLISVLRRPAQQPQKQNLHQ
jgi:exo-beta-1,3-glucanase (GH17 family)